MRAKNVLIAEDDRNIATFIGRGLRGAGYETTVVGDGETALLMARTGRFDLVVLDIGLPVMDGFTVLFQLRGEAVDVPVIVLTARDSVVDTVSGLEGGASDYMSKPFQFAELLARVRLRLDDFERLTPEAKLVHDGMVVDVRGRRVQIGPDTHDLTPREFALLELFLRHPGQVLSRDQILGAIWGQDFDPASNVVDAYVRALRAKIGAARVETVRGAGYRLR
jgi:two-component system OmpR family response regulator